MIDRAYEDIKSLEDTFKCYEATRLRRLFTHNESIELGRLILNRSFRDKNTALTHLQQYYRTPDQIVRPPMPCVCPEPEGLRWHRDFEAGEKVYWSHDPSNQPFVNAGVRLRAIFNEIETLCGARFEEVGNYATDIHIGYRHLDGRGGTLGVTFVPGTGDRLSACGPMCGDILFDLGEQWVPGGFYDTVAKHEIAHALGVPHLNSREALMYRAMIAIRGYQPLDIAEFLTRYPIWETLDVDIS